MKPDRSNYEIWFIDWIDGKLSDQQSEELSLFLRDNPDLREELESLSLVNLKSDKSIFTGKETLKKSAGSYSAEQFEHLCIACLENDLPAGHVDELREIISLDGQKRKTFELISRLKLVPPDQTFTRKSSVKKLTIGQKILRLSVIGLSSAATVAVLIVAWLTAPSGTEEKQGQIAMNEKQDTLQIRNNQIVSNELQIFTEPFNPVSETRQAAASVAAAHDPMLTYQPVPVAENPDSSVLLKRADPISTLAVKLSAEQIIVNIPPSTNLIAFKSAPLPPFFDDGRSNVEKFFGKFFHEKIMHDPESAYKPVETFDLAEAGITGLNKLFGWQLALQRNTDESGEVKSYYFSSKLLKFNTPVKKAGKEL